MTGLKAGIDRALGSRMAQHVRQWLTQTYAILLYRADELKPVIEEFLLNKCSVRRAHVAGDSYRFVLLNAEHMRSLATECFRRQHH